MRSLDEIHPSKDIQPLLMLTPGIDKRSTPSLRPYSPHVRLQRKPRCILKKNHSITLTFQSHSEFCLMSPEILPPLLLWPEQNGTSAVSANIPISLSVSGRDEHESRHDMPSSDILQIPHRPTSPWEFRNPWGISIKPHPAYSAHPHQGEGGVRNGHDQLPSLRQKNTLSVSTLQPPNGSNRTILRPESISSPTESTTNPQCGYRSMPPAFHPLSAAGSPWSKRGYVTSALSYGTSRYFWKAVYQRTKYLSTYYCRLL